MHSSAMFGAAWSESDLASLIVVPPQQHDKTGATSTSPRLARGVRRDWLAEALQWTRCERLAHLDLCATPQL